jgi:hypothetical protein
MKGWVVKMSDWKTALMGKLNDMWEKLIIEGFLPVIDRYNGGPDGVAYVVLMYPSGNKFRMRIKECELKFWDYIYAVRKNYMDRIGEVHLSSHDDWEYLVPRKGEGVFSLDHFNFRHVRYSFPVLTLNCEILPPGFSNGKTDHPSGGGERGSGNNNRLSRILFLQSLQPTQWLGTWAIRDSIGFYNYMIAVWDHIAIADVPLNYRALYWIKCGYLDEVVTAFQLTKPDFLDSKTYETGRIYHGSANNWQKKVIELLGQ